MVSPIKKGDIQYRMVIHLVCIKYNMKKILRIKNKILYYTQNNELFGMMIYGKLM